MYRILKKKRNLYNPCHDGYFHDVQVLHSSQIYVHLTCRIPIIAVYGKMFKILNTFLFLFGGFVLFDLILYIPSTIFQL